MEGGGRRWEERRGRGERETGGGKREDYESASRKYDLLDSCVFFAAKIKTIF